MPTFLNPDFTTKEASDFDWETLYAGYRWDEGGLCDLRMRILHLILGVFLSRDPYEYGDVINLAVYGRNNPTNVVDPTGEIAPAPDPDVPEPTWGDSLFGPDDPDRSKVPATTPKPLPGNKPARPPGTYDKGIGKIRCSPGTRAYYTKRLPCRCQSGKTGMCDRLCYYTCESAGSHSGRSYWEDQGCPTNWRCYGPCMP